MPWNVLWSATRAGEFDVLAARSSIESSGASTTVRESGALDARAATWKLPPVVEDWFETSETSLSIRLRTVVSPSADDGTVHGAEGHTCYLS